MIMRTRIFQLTILICLMANMCINLQGIHVWIVTLFWNLWIWLRIPYRFFCTWWLLWRRLDLHWTQFLSKLEEEFESLPGYVRGMDWCIYVFVCNVLGEQQFVTSEIKSRWDLHWTKLNNFNERHLLKMDSFKRIPMLFLLFGMETTKSIREAKLHQDAM